MFLAAFIFHIRTSLKIDKNNSENDNNNENNDNHDKNYEKNIIIMRRILNRSL